MTTRREVLRWTAPVVLSVAVTGAVGSAPPDDCEPRPVPPEPPEPPEDCEVPPIPPPEQDDDVPIEELAETT